MHSAAYAAVCILRDHIGLIVCDNTVRKVCDDRDESRRPRPEGTGRHRRGPNQ